MRKRPSINAVLTEACRIQVNVPTFDVVFVSTRIEGIRVSPKPSFTYSADELHAVDPRLWSILQPGQTCSVTDKFNRAQVMQQSYRHWHRVVAPRFSSLGGVGPTWGVWGVRVLEEIIAVDVTNPLSNEADASLVELQVRSYQVFRHHTGFDLAVPSTDETHVFEKTWLQHWYPGSITRLYSAQDLDLSPEEMVHYAFYPESTLPATPLPEQLIEPG